MLTQSQQWADRLKNVIPGGSSTGSKSAKLMPDEPGVIVRGKGCRVWDADGNEYIDYRNGLGPVTLGYQFPAVDDAIRGQLKNGIVFGHPHPLEGEVAEMLCEIIPCAERVRFLKTGGEAIAACIKLARYHTGRDRVVQIGYNGWLNSLSKGGRVGPRQVAHQAPPGIPLALSELHYSVDWNDTGGIEGLFAEIGDEVAALVVAADYGEMAEGKTFYPFLRDLADRYGTVLIFDEIVTGFRVAIGGMQEYFQVIPDLAVFAKGMANGMPLSVFCGRAKIMDKLSAAGVSITHGGETLSLAAAKVTIETYQTKGVVEHIWQKAERLWSGLARMFDRYGIPASIVGLWPCIAIEFESAAPLGFEDRFFRIAYRNGVSLYHVSYVNFSHQDADIDETNRRLENTLKELGQ